MTSFSTYYKSKYYPIGARGAGNKNAAKEAQDAVNDLINVNKLLENAQTAASDSALQNAEAFAVTRKLYTDLHGDMMVLVKDYTSLHEAESKYIKTFKIGTTDLIKRAQAYGNIQRTLKVTDASMRQYMSSMEKFAPLHGKIFADMAKGTVDQKLYMKAQMSAYDYLTKNTNMSADSQAKFSLFAAGANTTLQQQVLIYSDIAEELKGSIDKGVSFETVVSEIAEMSADVRSQYKKYPVELTKGILASKKLGSSMTELHNIGKSLLDIEQSTGKELEYQLLSGQRLTKNGKSLTNEYRKAMITGNPEKISAAMNDILDSQSKILDGENMYAKDALAQTLGVTTERLMQMNEQKKLAEQINKLAGDKIEIDLANLTDKKIEDIYKTGDDKLIKAINDYRSNEQKMMTPAQRIDEKFQYIIDKGLRVNLAKDQIDPAYQKKVLGSYQAVTSRGRDIFADTAGFAPTLGKTQIERKALDANIQMSKDFLNGFPFAATFVDPIVSAMTKIADNFYGKKIETQNVSAQTVNVAGSGVASNETAGDAVVGINDGIIKFHDRDRLTVVASPYGSMNEKVADKIANPSSNTGGGSVDTNSIVNAIKAGLSNISMTVNIDPMAIHKEIQFKIG